MKTIYPANQHFTIQTSQSLGRPLIAQHPTNLAAQDSSGAVDKGRVLTQFQNVPAVSRVITNGDEVTRQGLRNGLLSMFEDYGNQALSPSVNLQTFIRIVIENDNASNNSPDIFKLQCALRRGNPETLKDNRYALELEKFINKHGSDPEKWQTMVVNKAIDLMMQYCRAEALLETYIYKNDYFSMLVGFIYGQDPKKIYESEVLNLLSMFDVRRDDYYNKLFESMYGKIRSRIFINYELFKVYTDVFALGSVGPFVLLSYHLLRYQSITGLTSFLKMDDQVIKILNAMSLNTCNASAVSSIAVLAGLFYLTNIRQPYFYELLNRISAEPQSHLRSPQVLLEAIKDKKTFGYFIQHSSRRSADFYITGLYNGIADSELVRYQSQSLLLNVTDTDARELSVVNLINAVNNVKSLDLIAITKDMVSRYAIDLSMISNLLFLFALLENKNDYESFEDEVLSFYKNINKNITEDQIQDVKNSIKYSVELFLNGKMDLLNFARTVINNHTNNRQHLDPVFQKILARMEEALGLFELESD